MSSHNIDPAGEPYSPEKLPRKQDISGPDFFAMDMRVGTVEWVEEFPEARKPSLKIGVDFGPVVGMLQTSAQLTNYTDTDLIGRKVVGAINLGVRRIAGFESQFLVLAALEPDGTPKLLDPDPETANGSVVA